MIYAGMFCVGTLSIRRRVPGAQAMSTPKQLPVGTFAKAINLRYMQAKLYIVHLDKWMQDNCVQAATSDCGYESGCDYTWSWLQVVAGLQPQVVATAKGCG